MGDVLREQASGMPLRELEMRLFDPENLVITLAVDEALSQRPLSEGYRWLSENFTSICGETANLLRDFTFASTGSTGQSLEDVIAEILKPQDANLRIHCGGHAFFVEKRRGSCHILQSYIGKYSLSDSLRGAPSGGASPVPLANRLPATELALSLQAIGAQHVADAEAGKPLRTHPEEERLFGGPLFSKKDIANGQVRLECESTSEILSSAGQKDRIDRQLAAYFQLWDEIKKSDKTPAVWLGWE
ncbi:hypothetical protein ABZ667_43385 [Streptomyces lavendulae]|uniref:hypothetical protein n=1 Tax=Streptomyces lavendulae TaxID=1914 RepID=UPI0033F11236